MGQFSLLTIYQDYFFLIITAVLPPHNFINVAKAAQADIAFIKAAVSYAR